MVVAGESADDRVAETGVDGAISLDGEVDDAVAVEPGDAEPGDAEPGDAEPGDAEPGAPKRSWARSVFWAALLVGLVGVLYVGVTFLQVWRLAGADQARPADAVVVLGAAQWDGRPSPVFEARLRKAAELFEEGHADIIVTTGASQQGDRVTQGFAGFEFLRNQGVPEDALRIVTDGTNTYEELSAAALVLDDEDRNSVLLVSDPYHLYRARATARELGLEAYVVSTELDSTFRQLARETGAVAVGRIIGFRRVNNLS
jgi:uncharacterized SAM-binding protein YcdF (DUF218 family)